MPGRGPALIGQDPVAKGLASTKTFVCELYASVKAGAAAGKDLKSVYRETFDKLKPKYGNWVIFDHCMPFRRGHGLPPWPVGAVQAQPRAKGPGDKA